MFKLRTASSIAALATLLPAVAAAEEAAVPTAASNAEKAAELSVTADTIWVLVAAFLVFFMHAGFALLESGFCRKKNVVNILGKNMMIVAATSVYFYVCGFAFMFGNGNMFMGTTGFMVPDDAALFSALDWTSVPVSVKFMFQMVFAATAATIVSGAVAERIHYRAFIIFGIVMGAFIYPVAGHWIWGGGMVSEWGFLDFAGSTVVHSVGAWAALAGVIVLGARKGKYTKDGTRPIPGHNMTSAALGTFILWLGWFGFNAGSTMAAGPAAIGHIVLTTQLAAAAGAMVATFYVWMRVGKPDLGMTCNGALAGLVGITAPCAFVTGPAALLIGAIAGVMVVEGVILLDRLKLDDPVGAIAVHGMCGIWGTLALGLFADQGVSNAVAGARGDRPVRGRRSRTARRAAQGRRRRRGLRLRPLGARVVRAQAHRGRARRRRRGAGRPRRGGDGYAGVPGRDAPRLRRGAVGLARRGVGAGPRDGEHQVAERPRGRRGLFTLLQPRALLFAAPEVSFVA